MNHNRLMSGRGTMKYRQDTIAAIATAPGSGGKAFDQLRNLADIRAKAALHHIRA